jgi:chemotaxis protein histidine kinase CheA
MAMSNDPLNFFVLEAGECLEHLDAVLAGAGPNGPDAAEFVRYARTLRGAAIMHKLTGMADLAHAAERAGRALRDGTAKWTPALAAGLVAAVDDLKILLHNLRIWGPNEEARATRRLADLARLVPGAAASEARYVDAGAESFLAGEMAETAVALESLARPGAGSREPALQAALGRVRTLRGFAAIHDVPPVPEALDAAERIARTLALTRSMPAPAQTALFATVAALLRRVGNDLRAGTRPPAGTPEERRFRDAADTLAATASDADRIVPIDQLFYEDGSASVITPATRPPTTRAERFRLEVVSLAEHLRALVREAQAGEPGPIPDRITAELRRALRDVHRAADSYGERDIASVLTTFTDEIPVFDFLALHALDELGALLADPAAPARDLAGRMAELARGRTLDSGIAQGLGTSSAAGRAPGAPRPTPRGVQQVAGPTPPPAPRARPSQPGMAPGAPPVAPPVAPAVARPSTAIPSAPAAAAPASAPWGPGSNRPAPRRLSGERARTPTGRALQALLADGIAGISPIADMTLIDDAYVPGPVAPPSAPAFGAAPRPQPAMAPPAPAPVVPGASPVPIEALLYRGESALARARALSDVLRGSPVPTPDALAELYDLLDLSASA